MGGKEGMIGLLGRVVVALDPQGVVKVRGELWKASCTNGCIGVDEKVVVVGIRDLMLFVKPSCSAV